MLRQWGEGGVLLEALRKNYNLQEITTIALRKTERNYKKFLKFKVEAFFCCILVFAFCFLSNLQKKNSQNFLKIKILLCGIFSAPNLIHKTYLDEA